MTKCTWFRPYTKETHTDVLWVEKGNGQALAFCSWMFFLLDDTNNTKLVYIVWSVSKITMLHNRTYSKINCGLRPWKKQNKSLTLLVGILGNSRVDTNGFPRASCIISTLFCDRQAIAFGEFLKLSIHLDLWLVLYYMLFNILFGSVLFAFVCILTSSVI